MADVLIMPALQLCHPVSLIVPVKLGDLSLHDFARGKKQSVRSARSKHGERRRRTPVASLSEYQNDAASIGRDFWAGDPSEKQSTGRSVRNAWPSTPCSCREREFFHDESGYGSRLQRFMSTTPQSLAFSLAHGSKGGPAEARPCHAVILPLSLPRRLT